jgi:hypothetical protein
LTDDRELAAFVRDNLRSVWAMELLLLLHRAPERRWRPSELVRELRASDTLINDNLNLFQQHGLAVAEDAGWRFAPANRMLEELTERLARAFRERPVTTMGLVTGADPIQSLSDAFKIRGDE